MELRLKRCLALAEANLIELSGLIRANDELSEGEVTELLMCEELQSNVLARLANLLKHKLGSDDYLTELPDLIAALEFDPYPGEGEGDDEDDLLSQSIDDI